MTIRTVQFSTLVLISIMCGCNRSYISGLEGQNIYFHSPARSAENVMIYDSFDEIDPTNYVELAPFSFSREGGLTYFDIDAALKRKAYKRGASEVVLTSDHLEKVRVVDEEGVYIETEFKRTVTAVPLVHINDDISKQLLLESFSIRVPQDTSATEGLVRLKGWRGSEDTAHLSEYQKYYYELSDEYLVHTYGNEWKWKYASKPQSIGWSRIKRIKTNPRTSTRDETVSVTFSGEGKVREIDRNSKRYGEFKIRHRYNKHDRLIERKIIHNEVFMLEQFHYDSRGFRSHSVIRDIYGKNIAYITYHYDEDLLTTI